jgi:hypothetical protein
MYLDHGSVCRYLQMQHKPSVIPFKLKVYA